ncbi:hypothetical protein INT47_009707 [Mucor saturninus]|uniref:Uncharacterized protein n=1 Tax=Mucor saturninus TaxID=64648 RepID=A0A8H7UTB0_9FUNG|nr:hypothetical protein INT47_009707 [Mucor saturninus]
MNKLKSTFSLRHKDNERRSQVFMKRLSTQRDHLETPQVSLQDLSNIEHDTYLGWWRDLDPFGIGKADNKAIFNFVSGSSLPDHILEGILALFQNEKDGLNRQQFFAMLRLVAHAQLGRKVTKENVFLAAPLPRFQNQAIDALINSTSQTADMPSWMISLPNKRVAQPAQVTQSTQLPPTKAIYPGHSRSKSVPSANMLGPPADSSCTRHSGRASLNQDSLEKIMSTGNSLLLTKEFKPKFLDEENKNPFESTDSLVSTPRQHHTTLPNTSPNTDHIPPPPVPPQSTKPAFPKYARRIVI